MHVVNIFIKVYLCNGVVVVMIYKVLVLGNINVNSLKNDYSQAFGLSLWTVNDININKDSLIKISNINSGIKLDNGVLTYESKPNRVEIIDTADYYQSNVNFGNNNGIGNIITCNINGHERCLGDDNNGYTLYGSYFDNSDICDQINSLEYLKTLINSNDNDEKGNLEGLKNIVVHEDVTVIQCLIV